MNRARDTSFGDLGGIAHIDELNGAREFFYVAPLRHGDALVSDIITDHTSKIDWVFRRTKWWRVAELEINEIIYCESCLNRDR
jgi:hypothetical protein